MAPSPSSRLSSPLSDAGSGSVADAVGAGSGAGAVDGEGDVDMRPMASGSKSPLSDVDSRSRSQRSPTSSTVGLDPNERDANDGNDSDLTDMSDDENDEIEGDEVQEEGEEEVVPVQPAVTEEEQDEDQVSNATSSPPASDSGSLSPPPDSVEKKPKPLPVAHLQLPLPLPESAPPSTNGEVEDESELGSLTASNDSNADDAEDESGAGDDKPSVMDAVNLLGVGIADAGPLPNQGQHQEEAEEEEDDEEEGEDGEGDITMRAEDSAHLPNGTGTGVGTQATSSTEDEQQTDGPQILLEGEDMGTEQEQQEGEEQEQEQEPEIEGEGQEDQDQDQQEEAASPAPSIQPFRPHSSHPAPPTTAAMRSLLALEIKFAALRDRLYVERMEETAAEEEMILSGEHPALGYLFKNLTARRERLHEVASRRHRQVLDELARVREEEKECVWTWWTEERDREQWEEFEQTWAKRRRLIREKSELDIVPKRHKPIPKTWADAPRPLDWAAGAVPSTLSAKDAASDLAMMAPPRQPVMRQNPGPTMYGYPPAHSGPQYYSNASHAGPSEPVYASRVPLQHPHPQQAATPATAMHRPGQSAYGNAVFNVEPRREGRTVPTTSGLFDTARRPPSNELPNHPGPSHSQQHPQQSQAQMTAASKLDPWKQHPQLQAQAQAQQPGAPHASASASNMNGKGPSPVNGAVAAKESSPANANGSAAPAAASTGQAPAQPAQQPQYPGNDPNNRVGVRYPGLAPYLGANTPVAPPANRRPPQPQAQPPITSPPKSSLGITGVPTAMPFL